MLDQQPAYAHARARDNSHSPRLLPNGFRGPRDAMGTRRLMHANTPTTLLEPCSKARTTAPQASLTRSHAVQFPLALIVPRIPRSPEPYGCSAVIHLHSLTGQAALAQSPHRITVPRFDRPPHEPKSHSTIHVHSPAVQIPLTDSHHRLRVASFHGLCKQRQT